MIENIHQAKQFMIEAFKKRGERIELFHDVHKGQHFYIKTVDETYYAIFKREFFFTFNKQFPEFTEYKGIGESINKDALEYAVRNDAILLFIHEDKVYQVYPMIIKNYCEKHQLIRTQERQYQYKSATYTGEKEMVKETTYSFPVTLLTNIEKVNE